MRYGIFGGAFDPPHSGHLAVAQAAFNELNLQYVIFVPSFAPPHREQPKASFHHRVGMLQSLLKARPWALVSSIEMELSAPSYTFDMVKALKARQAQGQNPFLLVGADNYRTFTSWHRWKELLQEVEVVVYPRGNALPNALTEVPARFLKAPLRPEHSTDLRKALEKGLNAEESGCLPEVAAYAQQHGLYGMQGLGGTESAKP